MRTCLATHDQCEEFISKIRPEGGTEKIDKEAPVIAQFEFVVICPSAALDGPHEYEHDLDVVPQN